MAVQGRRAGALLFQLLDTVGDGSGSTDGAVDASSVDVDLKLTVPANRVYSVEELVISIEDNAAIVDDGYGAIAAGGLTEGCLLRVKDAAGTVLKDLLAGLTMKRTMDWNQLVTRLIKSAGTNFAYYIHIEFQTPIVLAQGHYLELTLQDDCSSLVAHQALAMGQIAITKVD
jgi:hypothetical protein